VQGLWPDDDAQPDWLLLRIQTASSSWSSGVWETHTKADEPWPGQPDDAIDVLEQPFWFGRLIVRTDPSGEQRVLRLAEPTPSERNRHWSEDQLDRSHR
jgi:hypothetical protein